MIILAVTNASLGSLLIRIRKKRGIVVKKCKTIKFRLVAILIIIFAFSLNVLAVKFYSINSLFRISTRVTNSICKDDNGFIWASSKTGILRLTDDDYRIYHLPYDCLLYT